VYLRPISDRDYEWIRATELAGEDGLTYRHRGLTPSPEQFAHTLWHGVVAQYVVSSTTGQPMGTVTSYGADFRNGWAYVAAFLLPEFRGFGWPLEGLEIFISRVFDAFPFRRLYFDVLEPNLNQFGFDLGGIIQTIARFPSHEYVCGEYVDRIVLSIERSDWERPDRTTLAPRQGGDQLMIRSPLLGRLRARDSMVHGTSADC
jgi:RimJ/RimL family protein N-acetyltransferase